MPKQGTMPNQGKRKGGQGPERTAGGGRSGGPAGRGRGHAAFSYQYPDSTTQGSGGKMTRSQSVGAPAHKGGMSNTPGSQQKISSKGSTGAKHINFKKGHATAFSKPVSGLVNPYLYVELEKSSIWKVIVPHGQSYGKQFLAGLEAWAQCMVDEYKRSPGSTPFRIATTTTPAPSASQQQHLPSPPPITSTPQSIPRPAGQSSKLQATPITVTNISSPAGGPLDWASYLTGGSTQQYSSEGTSSSHTALHTPATEGNYYRPVLDTTVQESSPHTAVVENLLAHGYIGDLRDNDSEASTTLLSASAPATAGLLYSPGSKLPVHAEDEDEGADVIENYKDEAHTQEFDDEDYADPYDDDSDGSVAEDEDLEEDVLLDKDQGGFEYSSLVFDDIKGDGTGRLDFDALDAKEVQPDVHVQRKRQASMSAYTPEAKRPAAVSAGVTTPVGRQAVFTAQQPIPTSASRDSNKGAASGATVRVRVSIRLERQALTDSEMELFTRWYKERGCHLIEISKLWLYDNRLGDAGAACVAQLMHPGLTEIHLSHNAITTQGAELLMASIPMDRAVVQGRPLWLRMEWNIINVDALLNFIKQQKQLRGLKVDVPKVVAGDGDNGHDMNLKLASSPHKLGSDMHVCLPWVACQKQAPSEAAVLQDVKNIYRSAGAQNSEIKPAVRAKMSQPNSLATSSAAAPPPPPLPSVDVLSAAASQLSLNSSVTTPAGQPTQPPPPPLPPASVLAAAVSPTKPSTTSNGSKPSQPLPAKAAAGLPAITELLEQGSHWPSGPLLLFPDTSALLSMIGANIDLKKPVFCLSSLMKLARSGRFGRQGLPPDHQVFIVIADSVMKQLDGLKSLPNARTSIRWFLSEGLEECGPAGLDFLTVLGAHEGEGLAMSTGALGSTGSRSPFVSSKGQQVDFRIVEVALFFMNEVLKAANNGNNEPLDSGSKHPLPVMLLSNDNAQISTARSHGLPAYRLYSESQTAEGVLRSLLQDDLPSSTHQQPCVLSACLLRGLFGPVATTGLGSAVPAVPLQDSFDSVVAAMQGVVGALHTAQLALSGITQAITNSSSATSNEEVEALLAMIAQHLHTPLPMGLSNGSEGAEASPTLLSESLAGLLSALQEPLSEWEARCRTHQQPSRVLKWMST